MEMKFDPKAKVKQGQLSDAPEGRQPNRPHNTIDFSQHAPRKYEEYDYDPNVPTLNISSKPITFEVIGYNKIKEIIAVTIKPL